MSQNTTEIIKEKLPIESVVGSYLKLEKSGKNFRAPCPFHHEKTPSFYVTPDRGIFYCYGCHKGGDIYNFVEEIEGVSFMEAKKILAEKAGVSLERDTHEAPSRAAILREIMDTATKFYEVGLRKNKEAVDYLLGRGLTKETMVAFRIGYAEKGWSQLYDLLKKKYQQEDIIATGLCLSGQKGVYDRFRERIMFPIADTQGRIIAFTGRVMPGTEEASRPVGKYINSPETELYHKSSVLFGYDKAKTYIHQQGFVILVEGQMDCIMAHQTGTKNVVAISGTACTDEHMNQLARFTNKIAICLDADKAGLAAAQKTAMTAYDHDMKVSAIAIPQGKDPADLIALDAKLWEEGIAHQKDFVTFRLENMIKDKNSLSKEILAEKELFPLLRHIHSEIILDDKLKEIAQSFAQTSVEPVRKDFERFLTKNPLATPVQKIYEAHAPNHKELLIVRMLGVLLSLQEGVLFQELKQQFETVVEVSYEQSIERLSKDAQAKYITETEHILGTKDADSLAYEKAFTLFSGRYRIALLEEEKERLDQKLAADPNDLEALSRIHEISKARDRLIHELHNH